MLSLLLVNACHGILMYAGSVVASKTYKNMNLLFFILFIKLVYNKSKIFTPLNPSTRVYITVLLPNAVLCLIRRPTLKISSKSAHGVIDSAHIETF